ncbi:hypothetical protein DLM45_00630 [Hyphomicrobium methylovorum]|uniref:hypothetical protein n=1 Tax=Hyphomicrobium methylovorum TaxID=84 RepID=UPI0015E70B8B|nr:hypothetical protein [Hyphomicrobium methylovorum]MBA2124734.1 hypothetical protein [Hyphomicrobium methylovorum]
MADPKSLEPGHIPGQNPNTPQRLPGNTAEKEERRFPFGRSIATVVGVAAICIVAYVILLMAGVSSPSGN